MRATAGRASMTGPVKGGAGRPMHRGRTGTGDANRAGSAMTTIRSTFRHASIYTLAAVLGKLISFFMLPFYAHILQDIGYGVIGMVETTLAFLMSLMAYGARGGIIRLYHQYPEEKKARVISTGWQVVGGVTAAIVLLLVLVSRPLSRGLLGSDSYAILLVMALVGFALELTGQAAASLLLIRRRSVFFSAVGLLRLFVGLGLNIWLVVILRWDLFGYFLSSLVTSLVSNGIFIGHALRQCGRGFDREIARDLVRFQLPLVPGNLASFAARQAERILVRFQLDLASVGILEMGYKFPALIGLLVNQPFMRSWNTTRTELAESGDPGAPRHIGQVYTFYLAVALFAALLIAVNIRTVLELLTPEQFWPAYRIARVEALTAVLTGSYMHLSFGLFYAKDTPTMAKLRGGMAVLKVGLSVLFISLWGLYGAAFSACASAALLLGIGGWLAQRRYAVAWEWRKIAVVAGTALLFFLVLTRWNLRPLAAWRWLEGTALPHSVELLSRTFLGTWKEGKAIRLLTERSALMADFLLRTALCLPYLAIIPVLHYETRQRLRRLLARR